MKAKKRPRRETKRKRAKPVHPLFMRPPTQEQTEQFFLKLANLAAKGKIQLVMIDYYWPHKVFDSPMIKEPIVVQTGMPVMKLEIMAR